MTRVLITLAATTLLGSAAGALAQPRAWVAPRSADARQNPLPNESQILAGGKKLYQQRCSVCHGEDGGGTNRGRDLVISRVQSQSDGALFWKISSGNTRTGMPTFSFLPEGQRWQLVMYLRTLARE